MPRQTLATKRSDFPRRLLLSDVAGATVAVQRNHCGKSHANRGRRAHADTKKSHDVSRL